MRHYGHLLENIWTDAAADGTFVGQSQCQICAYTVYVDEDGDPTDEIPTCDEVQVRLVMAS